MTVFIANFTASYESHFGCQLVCQTILEQLVKRGIHLVGVCGKRPTEEDYTLSLSADILLVNGEGTVHHGRGKELLELAQSHENAFLINAVWQDNVGSENLLNFTKISLRESKSYDEVPITQNKVVTPDLIFGAKSLTAFLPRKKRQLETLITDDVKMQHKKKKHLFQKKNTKEFTAFKNPQEVISDVYHAKEVYSGRFHIVCLCIYYGIPFRAWPSNTHKIEGLLKDSGNLDSLSADRKSALAAKARINKNEALDYREGAILKIDDLFSKVFK